MHRISRTFATRLIGTLSLALLAQVGMADELLRAGSEEQINTHTTDQQGFPNIAALPGGGYVVTWESLGQDGSAWGVYAQVVSSDGTAVGAELQVNTTTADVQWDPSVAADGNGNFVVAWHSYSAESEFDVRAQRFDSGGMPLGGELEVNSFVAGYQGNTSIAASSAGDFLVVWESEAQDQSDSGIYGQLYDSSGQAVGDELQINDTTASDQNDVRVAAIDGGYVVTWESLLQDGSQEATILRYLGTDGSPDSAEIVVNTFTAGDQEDPAVAVNADGDVAVVWESDAQDGIGEGVFTRVFDSSGAPVGTEMQLNSYTPQDQKNPRVAADGTGGFVAVWTSELQVDGTSEEIFGQRFDASGELVGDEFQVNTQATADQDVSSIAGGVGERFMVVWRSFGGQDGSGAGVFGQAFEIALFADGFEAGDTSAWSASSP